MSGAIIPFRPKVPMPRVELYAVTVGGRLSYVIDLIDEDGRENLHDTEDLADALRSADWCAEGDGSPGDLLPVVNLIEGDAL